MFLPFVVLTLIFLTQFDAVNSSLSNEFERANGCQQFNSYSGYNTVHPYFDTASFTNILTDDNGVVRLRIGVLGDKHAAIRFTSVSTDSETSMTEIALAHYGNTRTDIRKYPRTIVRSGVKSTLLGEFHVPNVMSIYKPVMMTVAIHGDGLVTVTRDGEFVPFLQFNDPSFSYKFIGFCKWDVPVVFFYDCPLLPAGDELTRVVSSKGCTRVNSFGMNSCLKVVECSDCNGRDNCFSRITKNGENQNDTGLYEEIKCF